MPVSLVTSAKVLPSLRVEEVAGGVVHAGLAVRAHLALLANGFIVEGVAHVIGDEEVEIAVEIVVEEASTGAPARVC